MSSSAPVLAGLVLALVACGDNIHRSGPDTAPPDAAPPDAAPPDADPAAPDAAQLDCHVEVHEVPGLPGIHFPPGAALAWSSNPPATGNHYAVWARWDRTYDTAIPPGYWVHNLEHGGVILLHHCPDGCPGDIAALTALTAALPRDASCRDPIRTRTLVTPDPDLPAGIRIAASAWNWTYTATCLDAPSLRAFIDAHYGKAPEDLCNDGGYPAGAR